MTVYVDDVKLPFRAMIMCHLWADSEAELLAMVDRIGVDRKWIQGHPTSIGKAKDASWVHFDIAMSKKALAIAAGAVLTDRYGPAEHTARLTLADPTAAERSRDRARGQLTRIAVSRAMCDFCPPLDIPIAKDRCAHCPRIRP